MAFLDFFKQKKITKSTSWQELGRFNARFTAFGNDAYASDIVRASIRPLCEFTSKASAKCTHKEIEDILNDKPNLYMSGPKFLDKVRLRYELYNSCFIYIQRDERNRVTGFYPIPYSSFEAIDYEGRLFIKFQFLSGTTITLSWDDLAVIVKDYNKSDIAGDDNYAILEKLELINITNQGIGNAVKSTANLRGILKSTKAMLSDEDLKKQKDRFVKDYMSLSNEGGIASLDGTQEFIPIKMEPQITSAEQMKEFREDVYRYYGVNEKIVTGLMTPEELEVFYELRIEPFLVQLSTELTSKTFSKKEKGFGNSIIYEANRMQFISIKSKLQMVQLVDRAIMTPNELREIFNLAPYEGGDEFVRRLDTMPINETSNEPTEDDDEIFDNNPDAPNGNENQEGS